MKAPADVDTRPMPGADRARAMLAEPDPYAGARADAVRRAEEEADRVRPRPAGQEPLFVRAPLRSCRSCATSMHSRHAACPSCGGAWDGTP